MNSLSSSTIVAEFQAEVGVDLNLESCCLALTGSAGEGLSTLRSDIDLLFVTQNPLPVVSGSFFTTSLAGRKAEILVFDTGHFSQEIERLNQARTILEELSTIDYVHRLTRAVPIFGDSTYSVLLQPFSYENFKVNARKITSFWVHSSFEDYLGSLGNSDRSIAIGFCRRLMWACMDLLLVSRGDTYDRPKWRLSRVKRTLGTTPELVDEYVNRELTAPVDNDAAQATWLGETLRFCQRLQLSALEENAESLPKRRELTSDLYTTAESTLVAELRDRHFITSSESMYQVDEPTAEIFLRLWRPGCARSLLSEINSSGHQLDQDGLDTRLEYLKAKRLIVAKDTP